MAWPTVAWIHLQVGAGARVHAASASWCSSCCMRRASAAPRRCRALRQRLLDALDGELQALAFGGLEHVVGHALLEGLDRVLVVGGDEDDLAAAPASSSSPLVVAVVVDRHLRDLARGFDAGQAGHADVEEDDVGPVLVPSSTASRPFLASATISSSGQTSARRARSCSRIRRSSSARTARQGCIAHRRRAGRRAAERARAASRGARAATATRPASPAATSSRRRPGRGRPSAEGEARRPATSAATMATDAPPATAMTRRCPHGVPVAPRSPSAKRSPSIVIAVPIGGSLDKRPPAPTPATTSVSDQQQRSARRVCRTGSCGAPWRGCAGRAR